MSNSGKYSKTFYNKRKLEYLLLSKEFITVKDLDEKMEMTPNPFYRLLRFLRKELKKSNIEII